MAAAVEEHGVAGLGGLEGVKGSLEVEGVGLLVVVLVALNLEACGAEYLHVVRPGRIADPDG